MARHTVTLIPGDSTGPELARATQRLVAAAGADIVWDEVACGRAAFEAGGNALPEALLASVRAHKVALKGRLDTPVGAGYESPNVRLRKLLGCFAAVRPIRSLRGIPSRYDDVDVVIVREATEDVYAGIEHTVVPGVVQSIKITTRAACERIVHHAFAVARRYGRKKVTLVHKANIMKKADGLFLEVGRTIAPSYPDIAFDAVIADNACMQLVRRPGQYEVLVAQNLFGDLLSDLGAGLVGGIAPVWGTLEDGQGLVVFEALHGIAHDLEGKGVANPLPFIQPAIALLRHLGEGDAAARIERGLGSALEAGVKTRDLGGSASTDEVIDAIIARW
ncbi:MAG: NAD-dependent isocitrate dehydrogenase [Deltaproteobacteria bacterium]|nr:NAD-dependent isocitrate dehydrogenase [Deltaproteobacteria bacterium]